ncbi:Oxidase ustYa [Cladobotryum mycophilum]|uniref:Oxidase ustYa n=1 Tax=Cladobotryum mycophilum TaxID=491253 RepID=A0ABR0SWL7_9HYPO
MPAHFVDDESDHGSNEFLIEHKSSAKNRKSRRWSLSWTSLAILALFIGVTELIVLETIFVQLSSQNQGPPLLGELNNLVPNFFVRQVLFRKDPSATVDHHTEASKNATHDNWLSYLPRGNGFIAVNDTKKYTLPDPILFRGHEAYSIAVFHQLHCLYTIMDVYNNLANPASKLQRDSAHHGDSHPDSHTHNHVDHCFRYLRQSLVCCGDTALEGQDPNTDTFGTDGTGAVHMCKDFEAIRSWADEHRIVDGREI